MSRFTRKRGEQIQTDIQKRERKYRARRIDEAVQRAYEHLYDGEFRRLVTLMRDILTRDMGVTRHTLRDHAETVLESAAELHWNHEAVRRFVENPDRYLETELNSTERNGSGQLYLRAAGMTDPRERQRDTVVEAFHSLESLAVARGWVSNSVTNWAPARGYALQMGTWYQPPRDDMPFDIQLVNPGDSEEVTVAMGKPGRGKGVWGHTETEDRAAAGRKIIDLVDFDECEGGTLDIPNANPILREAREDMGLPPDFTEHPEYEPPNVEIMVPLTDGLADRHIPYYGDGPTDTVVRPFTVPASRLSKRALKRFISAELTPTQVNVFESAYDEIQRSRDDWNLHELIMAVERHRGLHGNQGAVDRVMRAIRRVQSKGWIRDKDDPHCIDWGRILTDTDTATVFTASLMEDTDEAAKYLFHSYVIYGFRTELKRLKALPSSERDGWKHVPKMTGLARELHKIAPNAVTAADDPTIRDIQEAMTSDFRDLTAMHRHEGVELICDTQNFIGEIKKRGRKNFNRAALFQVDFSDAKEMFQEMAGELREKYPKRVTQRFGVGECAVLGRVGTNRSFEMTVAVAPPMSHHFDPDEWVHPERGVTKDRESLKREIGGDPEELEPEGWESVNSGWDIRVYLGGEEYRPARELLNATNAGEVDRTDLETVRNSDRRPEHGPGQFAWDCLEIVDAPDPGRSSDRVILKRLETAYINYAEHHGHRTNYGARSNLCQVMGGAPTPTKPDTEFREVWDLTRPVIHDFDGGQENGQVACYSGVRLNERGEAWANGEVPEDAGDPAGEGEDTTEEPDDGGPEPGDDVDVSASEDAAHPATEDMDCCGSPEPVPIYAGEEQDEQMGWRCEACGGSDWF